MQLWNSLVFIYVEVGKMKLADDVKRVKRPDKSFVFSSKKGDLFETNEVGEVILDKIKEGKNEKEIVEFLQKETGEEKEMIEKDVKEFIVQLKENNFLI